jgi:hypothetical protein
VVILVEAVEPDHEGAYRITVAQRAIHLEPHEVQHLRRGEALLLCPLTGGGGLDRGGLGP